jgi:hypothetical protein
MFNCPVCGYKCNEYDEYTFDGGDVVSCMLCENNPDEE